MNDTTHNKSIVFLLFERFTALDVIGPYEILSRLPGYEVIFAAIEKKYYKDDKGLELKAGYSLKEITSAEILLIPGGFGTDMTLKDEKLIGWIQKMDRSTRFTVSVCSGSLLLAEAGLLKGKRCTTHWRRMEQLSAYNLKTENSRYVQDGKYITSAGVSAGMDMGLYLAALLAGENTAKAIQLGIEYDPDPPFDCGSPGKAPDEILQKFRKSK